MRPILQVSNLTVRYGSITAVFRVDVKAMRGESVAVIGPNGSGKTTLFRAICGLVKPASGSILFEGREVQSVPAHERVRLGLVYCPERARVITELNVLDNLMLGAYLVKDKAAVKRSLEYVFQIFPPLADRKHQASGTLSGGERQMLVVGRALMLNPKLMLLDEPLFGLAQAMKTQVLTALESLRASGTAILVAEHDIDSVMKVCERIYAMKGGEIVFEGPVNSTTEAHKIKAIYN